MRRKTRIPNGDILDAQKTAARLLICHDEWSKDRIAEAAGISRNTLYSWLRDSRFLNLLESIRNDQRHHMGSLQDVVSRLDDEAKSELLSRLEECEREGPDRVATVERHVRSLSRRIESASEAGRAVIVAETERLIGRLSFLVDPSAGLRYHSDGSPKPATLDSLLYMADDLAEIAILEHALIGTDLDEARLPSRLAYAIAAEKYFGISADELDERWEAEPSSGPNNA